jgi:deoxyguanosine kinase
MTTAKTFYIALGSNKGDKFKNLQDAIDLIHARIGIIIRISKVYKSPAFGFESDDFLNACLVVESDLQAQEVLEQLLVIEVELGRFRSKKSTYEARTIDLDIVFVQGEIIDTNTLQVPHPEMQKRKFVLLPLNDVAPSVKHPILNKEVSELLETCEDESILEPINIWLKNTSKGFDFSKYNYIAIEGNIGAGKTSLASKIAHDFNAKLILERFADNPFLPKFYEDAARYAFFGRSIPTN